MKATVDPDSAEGRAEIDRLQHQILQIYQSLRGRLRRENRASLKSQRAVLIQQLESLGMATKEQKGGSVVFTPVASGVEATIDPGIVVQSILDPRKTRKLEELTVPVRLDDTSPKSTFDDSAPVFSSASIPTTPTYTSSLYFNHTITIISLGTSQCPSAGHQLRRSLCALTRCISLSRRHCSRSWIWVWREYGIGCAQAQLAASWPLRPCER